jgi:hypothetical protein
MARSLERDLYQALIDSRFCFLGSGERHIDDIYQSVRVKFPALCDDTFYCSENCESGNDQPEWKHTVRNALQRLKTLTAQVRFTGKRGFWRFG